MAVDDVVIEHVGAVLEGYLAPGDVTGRIKGVAFGLILIGRCFSLARREVKSLTTALQAHLLVWRSIENPISITGGLHPLTPGEDAGEALAVTDLELQDAERKRNLRA